MEAKDLMIGDYVKCSPHCLGHRVDYISELEEEVGVDGEILSLDMIEPIPLTPEFLELNGWEERPTGYVFYTDGKRYDNSLWYIFGSNTFVISTAEFQIKYVHELQHALKMCGIKKEIEL